MRTYGELLLALILKLELCANSRLSLFLFILFSFVGNSLIVLFWENFVWNSSEIKSNETNENKIYSILKTFVYVLNIEIKNERLVFPNISHMSQKVIISKTIDNNLLLISVEKL